MFILTAFRFSYIRMWFNNTSSSYYLCRSKTFYVYAIYNTIIKYVKLATSKLTKLLDFHKLLMNLYLIEVTREHFH